VATSQDMGQETAQQYFYHTDHLGSAQMITNKQGNVTEHIEYTPYGELWIEQQLEAGAVKTPYRFTVKELDSETGLYYYGARYLDPKTSRWLSTDPAMGEYIPGAPINDEVRRQNRNLPGMGGVFNYVNLHTYHYAGNNPVVLTDPDGRKLFFSGSRTERRKFLTMINSVSNEQYRFRWRGFGNYELVKTNKLNESGLKENSDIINRVINDDINLVGVFASSDRVGGANVELGNIAMPDITGINTEGVDANIDFYSSDYSLVFNTNLTFTTGSDGKEKGLLISFMIITMDPDFHINGSASSDEIIGNIGQYILPQMDKIKEMNYE
jgi:RHS repeat-associated protein